MKLSQFKFKLPEEQVALYPPHRAFENEDGTIDRVYNRDQCKLISSKKTIKETTPKSSSLFAMYWTFFLKVTLSSLTTPRCFLHVCTVQRKKQTLK